MRPPAVAESSPSPHAAALCRFVQPTFARETPPMRMSKPLSLLRVLLVALALVTSGCQTLGRVNKGVHDAVFGENPTTQKTASSQAKPTADPADDGDHAKKEKEPAKTLYERLGGEAAIVAVVDDVVARSAANPAINFTRRGTPRDWQP